jgi:CheY-like chemotaxis protein
LKSLQEQFAPVAAQRGITLVIAPTNMRVRSDSRLLRRVLQNFIGNALRYTPAGGVLLGARRRAAGAMVELQVIDTGPGIPAENRRAIFEEFRRLDQPSPWGEKGLGLGLSICERIATILGTTLTLRSEAGRGSTFSIHVPRATGRAPAAVIDGPLSNPIAAAEKPQRTRVLCVDDDAATLAGLRELLVSWKFDVIVASTPEEAQAIADTQPVDVVLADFHLQDRPAGLDLLQRLVLQTPAGTARAGALLTADATEILLLQAAELGIPVLRKPVRPAALRALISALVDRVARAAQPSSSGAGGAN